MREYAERRGNGLGKIVSKGSDKKGGDGTWPSCAMADTEQDLRAQASKLATLLEAAVDTIITIDDQGVIESVNPAAERLFQYKKEEFLGRNVRFLMPEPYRSEHDGYLQRFLRTGERKIIGIGREVVGQRRDGSTFPMHLSVSQFTIDGQIFFTGIIHDLTLRHEADARATRLGRIVEASSNEIFVFHAESLQFLTVNTGARRNLGYSETQLQTMTPVDIKPDFDWDTFERTIAPLRTGVRDQLQFETRHRRNDGSVYEVEVNLSLQNEENPPVFVAVILDITERKAKEERLRLLERTVRTIQTGILITTSGDHTPIIYCNPAFEAMTGYSMSEVLGRNPRFLYGKDKDQPESRKIRDGLMSGNSVNVVIKNYKKNGQQFLNDLTIVPLGMNGGTATHYIGVLNDITERRQTERALQQSQKIEAIGQLTGGIAHDFNNLLSVIIGNLELMEDRVVSSDDRDMLKDAQDAADLGAKLTQRLLAFARRSILEPEIVEPNILIVGLTEMLRRTLEENIDLGTALSSDLWRVKSDPAQIESAIINLAVNARDAMPEGGHLLVETRNAEFNDRDVAEEVGLQPGQYVQLSVTDSGTGMPPEIRDKVFEPFFTTKQTGHGTGLGLSMVYGFAKQSGGHATVYSEEGTGTTVNIYLPRCTDEAESAGFSGTVPLEHGNREDHILLVEDDDRVRLLTTRRLKALGYTVSEAANGPEALEIFAKDHSITLVLSDLIMPGGLSGEQLCRKVQEQRPEVKALLTSGYAGDFAQNGVPNGNRFRFLRKPYRTADLARIIRETLADG